MRFGLALATDFPPGTDVRARIGPLLEQVAAAREAGFDSIWALQHYLGNLPTLQPLPLLARLAAETGRMRVGTNMFILPLRHPVDVAEDFATLHHLAEGGAIAGLGLGYRENEFAAFGVPLEDRVARYTEAIAILRALWAGEAVTVDGEHFRLDGAAHQPARTGHPDLGRGGPAPHRRAARGAAGRRLDHPAARRARRRCPGSSPTTRPPAARRSCCAARCCSTRTATRRATSACRRASGSPAPTRRSTCRTRPRRTAT